MTMCVYCSDNYFSTILKGRNTCTFGS